VSQSNQKHILEGYKQTEVGVIPEDWEAESLGQLVSITSGESPSKYVFVDSGVPYFKVEQLNNHFKYAEETCYHFTKGKTVSARSVVFPKRGASILLNKIRIFTQNSFMDTNLMSLTTYEGLDSEYLYYFLTYEGLESVADTTSIPQINNKHIIPFVIPLPEPEEQTAIANALSDVDGLIGSLEKLIAKKRAIKTAAMQQLLTGKKRLPPFDKTHTGYKQTELGEIPNDWEVSSIGSVLSITTGDKNTQDKDDNGQYPFFVRSQTIEHINSYSFDGEAVLTAGDGVGTGKIYHYIKGKFDFHQRVYLMHNFCERLNGYYFYIYFSNNFYDRIMSMTAKSSVDSVRREMISDMKIVLPPIDEQIEISKVLTDMEQETEALEHRLNKTKQIKNGMMQELLTGKTRLV